jgi:predicted acetyltransferase
MSCAGVAGALPAHGFYVETPPAMTTRLEKPSLELLAAYAAALERGWGPDNLRVAESAREQRERIALDPAGFIASLDDPEARGGPITMPDGSKAVRLPGYTRWIWDEDFCGSINFRWQNGISELPPYVLGHIGYSVVPWQQGRGFATAALRLLLPDARARGLEYVELTTEVDNIASQRVIRTNGGYPIERFRKLPEHGGAESIRFRIDL